MAITFALMVRLSCRLDHSIGLDEIFRFMCIELGVLPNKMELCSKNWKKMPHFDGSWQKLRRCIRLIRPNRSCAVDNTPSSFSDRLPVENSAGHPAYRRLSLVSPQIRISKSGFKIEKAQSGQKLRPRKVWPFFEGPKR